MRAQQRITANALRADLAARNLARSAAERLTHEVTYGRVPSVVYGQSETGGHGNFLQASYRRILANNAWRERLDKVYTGSARLPRQGDRRRHELECAGSSDALLMNVFCYPGVLCRPLVCGALGIRSGLRPAFGVRACLPMRRDEVDRTEFDMALDDLLVEAKLTEGGFGRASRERLLRYLGAEEVFDVEALPQSGGQFLGYQVIRGVLAAEAREGRYAVLLDVRRSDLVDLCFRILSALRSPSAHSRFRLHSWQELASTLPRTVQTFLAQKYGIVP